MSLKPREVKLAFASIYLVFMTSRAIFNPFVTVYLQERGLSPKAIGTVAGIGSLVIIFSQPFWGIVSDTFKSLKNTLALCLVLQALCALLLGRVEGFALVALCYAAYTFFASPEGPILDTWSLSSMKEIGERDAVGRLKLWGSLGFAASAALSGSFIGGHATTSVLPVYAGVLFAIGIALFALKLGSSPAKAHRVAELRIGRILGDRTFLLFLAYIFFMQLPHRAGYTFFPLLIRQLGGDKSVIGLTSAVMFLSEATLFYFSKRLLARVTPIKLIIASSAFFAIWQLLYSVVGTPLQVTAIAVLDGPAYALFTIGVLYYLDKIAPAELRTTYQTIAYAVYFGLAGIAGNLLGGTAIEGAGYRTMFRFGALLIILSSVVFGVLLARKKGVLA